MSASSFEDIALHLGHEITVVIYGDDVNAAIECETCNEVLVDYDNEEDSQDCGQLIVAIPESLTEIKSAENKLTNFLEASERNSGFDSGEAVDLMDELRNSFRAITTKNQGGK